MAVVTRPIFLYFRRSPPADSQGRRLLYYCCCSSSLFVVCGHNAGSSGLDVEKMKLSGIFFFFSIVGIVVVTNRASYEVIKRISCLRRRQKKRCPFPASRARISVSFLSDGRDLSPKHKIHESLYCLLASYSTFLLTAAVVCVDVFTSHRFIHGWQLPAV